MIRNAFPTSSSPYCECRPRVGHWPECCHNIKNYQELPDFSCSRQLQRVCFPGVIWSPYMMISKCQQYKWHRAALCLGFLLLARWSGETFTAPFRGRSKTAVQAMSDSQGEQIWWVKMNNYQQQVWALSNALASLLRDTEASKFPPTLRAKTMELQQSCNALEKFISTSTSRIQRLGRKCRYPVMK